MVAGGDVSKPAIELKLNRARGNIERERAVSAVIVLPAAMLLLKTIVAERFDGFVKWLRCR